MAETYAARKERERQRDLIREWAWKVAQHVAFGDMNSVERIGYEGDNWPPFRFGPCVSSHRCECGMTMIPLPTFDSRYGILPTWYCAVCNLKGVVEQCEQIAREAVRRER